MKNIFGRYLELTGIEKSAPSLDNLNRIVQSHLMKIPFENISKLYYYKKSGLKYIPAFNLYLDGIKEYNFGGTCYSNNFHLNELLKHLGYNARLCGADMNNPNVHTVNIVDLDGKEYIIDAGYGAPFMCAVPIKQGKKFSLGNEEYIFSPADEFGRTKLTFFRDGKYKHSYVVSPEPRTIDFFKDVIIDSFRPGSTFLNCLTIIKFSKKSAKIIRNMSYIEFEGSDIKRKKINSRKMLYEIIESVFSIPKDIAEFALEDVEIKGDAWG